MFIEDIESEYVYGQRTSFTCFTKLEYMEGRPPKHITGIVQQTFWEENGDFVVVVKQDNGKLYNATFKRKPLKEL